MSPDLCCSLTGETPVATVTWTIAPAQQKIDERWKNEDSRCKWQHEWIISSSGLVRTNRRCCSEWRLRHPRKTWLMTRHLTALPMRGRHLSRPAGETKRCYKSQHCIDMQQRFCYSSYYKFYPLAEKQTFSGGTDSDHLLQTSIVARQSQC